MSETPHVDGRLDDWLDERLGPAERADVDRHLSVCGTCRGLRDALVASRRVLRESDAAAEPPQGLEAKIFLALDREDEAEALPASPVIPHPSRKQRVRTTRTRRTWALAAAAAFAIVLGGLGVWFALTTPTSPGPLDDAFAQYTALEAAGPGFAKLAVTSPDELQARWQQADLGIEARVLDLRAMGIELAAGNAATFGEHEAALAVYTNQDGAPVVCWMFQGTEAEFPKAVEEHVEREFHFRIFEREGITLVVWREGDTLCVLARRGPRHEVLALAIGKAMAPVVA